MPGRPNLSTNSVKQLAGPTSEDLLRNPSDQVHVAVEHRRRTRSAKSERFDSEHFDSEHSEHLGHLGHLDAERSPDAGRSSECPPDAAARPLPREGFHPQD